MAQGVERRKSLVQLRRQCGHLRVGRGDLIVKRLGGRGGFFASEIAFAIEPQTRGLGCLQLARQFRHLWRRRCGAGRERLRSRRHFGDTGHLRRVKGDIRASGAERDIGKAGEIELVEAGDVGFFTARRSHAIESPGHGARHGLGIIEGLAGAAEARQDQVMQHAGADAIGRVGRHLRGVIEQGDLYLGQCSVTVAEQQQDFGQSCLQARPRRVAGVAGALDGLQPLLQTGFGGVETAVVAVDLRLFEADQAGQVGVGAGVDAFELRKRGAQQARRLLGLAFARQDLR